MDGSLHVVVVGAGIGGLGSSIAFARSGHRVTLVERDDTPMPADVEGAFAWDRRGAPQVRHPHAFLGLGRTILRDRFPDVLQALGDNGVHTVSLLDAPFLHPSVSAALATDDDLLLLGCRRTTFEWVLRHCVLAEPNVELRVGTGVTGVVATGTPPRVTGLRMQDGSTIDADLVITSTGRRGDVTRWLADHGVDVPEQCSDAGVVYFSRFYRADKDNSFGFRVGLGAGVAAGVIGADAGTYSITAVVDKRDREMRAHLTDSERFDATMRLMPDLADVIEFGGTPIHPAHCMTGLINRLRRYTDANGNPLAIGLLAVGDAHTCTNPAYGRGQSLALLQATMAADAVAANDDLESAARQYEADSAARVEPWYHLSALTDRLRPTLPGSSTRNGGGDVAGIDLFGALSAAAGDPELFHVAARVLNLLETPQALWARLPDLQRVAADAAAPRSSRRFARPRVRRPSRDEILAVGA